MQSNKDKTLRQKMINAFIVSLSNDLNYPSIHIENIKTREIKNDNYDHTIGE